MKEYEKQKLTIQFFRNFLHLLPERIVNNSVQNGQDILLFLTHFHRYEITEFWDLFEDTKAEAKQGVSGIRHSLRSSISEYVIMFMSNGLVPIEILLPIIQQKVEPKQVLGINIQWFNEDEFGLDFLFWDDTK